MSKLITIDAASQYPEQGGEGMLDTIVRVHEFMVLVSASPLFPTCQPFL